MGHLIRNPHVASALAAAVDRDERGMETISTVNVPAPLRNAVWEARVRSHLIGLKTGSPAATGLVGTMRSAVVNGLSIADITGNAHTVERTPAMADQMRIDSVMFTFVLAGESFHFNGTTPVLVKQGEVAIYDSDSPFMLGFSEGMRVVAASVPRYHLADIGMQDSFRSLKVVGHARGGAEGRSAGELLDVLGRAFDRPSDLHLDEFAEGFVDDVLRAVSHLFAPHRPSAATYFAEAQALIQSRLSDPDLSVPDIAQALSLSPRHLSRIFSAHDTTVAQAIQSMRLDHAHHLLTSASAAHMSAAEVAARSGFTSPSHFSRVFRQHFGMTPTEARARRRSS